MTQYSADVLIAELLRRRLEENRQRRPQPFFAEQKADQLHEKYRQMRLEPRLETLAEVVQLVRHLERGGYNVHILKTHPFTLYVQRRTFMEYFDHLINPFVQRQLPERCV